MARSRRDRDDDDDDDRPSRRRSSRDDDDDDDRPAKKKASRRDEDDEDERPAKKKPVSRSRDDDDEEEERPAKKKPVSRARDEDDDEERPAKKKAKSRRDDDDDDDDRPKKRRRVVDTRKSGGPMLLILAGVGGVVVLGVVGLLLFLFVFNENPKSAFEDAQNAVENKDAGRLYDRLDTDTQKLIVSSVQMQVKMDPTLSAHANKTGRELFVAVAEEQKKKEKNSPFEQTVFKKAKVESVEESGDTATLTVRNTSGEISKVKMVKQEGRWRISLFGGGVFGK